MRGRNEGEGNLIPLTFLLYLMVYCHPSSLDLLFFLCSLLDTRLVNLSQLTTLLTTAEMLLLSPSLPRPSRIIWNYSCDDYVAVPGSVDNSLVY